jgi:hypothetical protein
MPNASLMGTEVGPTLYTIRRIRFDDLSSDDLSQWKFIRSRYPSPKHAADPDWLRGYFDGQTQDVSVYILYHYGVPNGSAVFISRDWPLDCYLGDFRVLRFPMRRLRLIGLDWPDDELAHDALLIDLEFAGYDAIFLDSVPVDSFLWKYVQTTDDAFRTYRPNEPMPRPRIRVEGTFESYLKRFSARHRHNLRRRVSKFREDHTDVRWVRYSAPEEVNAFLDLAVAISRKTYQWRLFDRGLTDTEKLRHRLEFTAANGWFRSYVLFSGDKPISFVAGWQHAGIYDHHEIGYDPDYRKYGPGTVLHMFMIEDLFTHNPPQILDFGSYAAYKQELATEGGLEGTMFLFRRGMYTWAAERTHRASAGLTKMAGAFLEKWKLKGWVKAMVRR